MFLKIAQKVTLHLGYFWKKVCHQELSKIAQFDHTAYISIERALNARKAVKKKQRAVALIERSMQKNGIFIGKLPCLAQNKSNNKNSKSPEY